MVKQLKDLFLIGLPVALLTFSEKKMEKINNKDLSWIAGFFEGEGTVRISKPRKGQWGYLAVSVVGTDKKIIKWHYDLFGGYLQEIKTKRNRKTAWRWRIAAGDALGFLNLLYPFLKREIVKGKFQVGIEFQQQKELHPKWKKDESYYKKQNYFYLKMKKLNQRGLS